MVKEGFSLDVTCDLGTNKDMQPHEEQWQGIPGGGKQEQKPWGRKNFACSRMFKKSMAESMRVKPGKEEGKSWDPATRLIRLFRDLILGQ